MLLKKIFMGVLLTLEVIICQKDSDESRPYEFGFTIDGQQHRHEKKDQNGIIQGEFGFITADGVYHVTVYATDENGDFKILSMRNIRISAPLDGSPALGPISPEASKYLKQANLPNQIPATPSKPPPTAPQKFERIQQAPLEVSTQKQTTYAFTTLSTIRPACAGCGLITTPKPGDKFVFQNPAFKESPPTLTGPKIGQKPQGSPIVQAGGQPNLQNRFNDLPPDTELLPPGFNGNIVPSTADKSPQNIANLQQTLTLRINNPNNQVPQGIIGLHAFGTSGGTQVLGDNKIVGGVSQGITGLPAFGTSGGTQPVGNNKIVSGGSQGITGLRAVATGGSTLALGDNKVVGDVQPLTGFIQGPGKNQATGGVQGPSNVPKSGNIQATSGLETFGEPVEQNGGGLVDSINSAQQLDNVEEVTGQVKQRTGPQEKFQRLMAPPISAAGPNPLLQPQEISKLPPVMVQDKVIHVMGKKPVDIPIKDKYPGMVDGLPNGVEVKDVTNILYKFKYTVGFHGHYEKGLKDGSKIGGYFVNGRDGISRIVTYVADENGYRPKFKFINLGLDSPDTPNEKTEKTFGLKDFEFVWYPVE